MEHLGSINVLLRRGDPLRVYPIAARVSAILVYLGRAHIVVRVLIFWRTLSARVHSHGRGALRIHALGPWQGHSMATVEIDVLR